MHMKNRSLILALIAVILLAVLLPVVALAQTYTYSLPQQFIDLYINADGTYSIDYLFIFVNDPSGPTIEYVDVGVPNSNYDLNSVVAYANGVELSDIEESPYVQPGVAVGLGAQSIPAGQSGEVRVFIARVRDVLFPDDDDENYASARFAPNFFEDGSISGGTETILTRVDDGTDVASTAYWLGLRNTSGCRVSYEMTPCSDSILLGLVKIGGARATISPRRPDALLSSSDAGSHDACQLESWGWISTTTPPAWMKSSRFALLSRIPRRSFSWASRSMISPR